MVDFGDLMFVGLLFVARFKWGLAGAIPAAFLCLREVLFWGDFAVFSREEYCQNACAFRTFVL